MSSWGKRDDGVDWDKGDARPNYASLQDDEFGCKLLSDINMATPYTSNSKKLMCSYGISLPADPASSNGGAIGFKHFHPLKRGGRL